MPVIKFLPDEAPSLVVNTPQTLPEEYRSQFVSLLPTSDVSSLMRYVEGMPWEVNFYGQLLNKDDGVQSFDPAAPSALQPYYKINKLILRVTAPLDSSYNAETGVTTIFGAAVAPFSVKPNTGDSFVASIDSGEDGIFTINNVGRKSFNKGTLYEISYSLSFYASTQPDWVATMEERVQQTYYYTDADMYGNKGSLVIPSVYEAQKRLGFLLRTSVNFYFNSFYNIRFGTIVMPGQSDTMYDPLLMKFLFKILNTNVHPNLIKISSYNHASNYFIDQVSIWDSLLSIDPSMLYVCNKKYRYVYSGNLPMISRLAALPIVGLNFVLFPMDANVPLQVRMGELSQPSILSPNQTLAVVYNHNVAEQVITIPVNDVQNNTVVQKPLLHALFEDDYYVLSKHFYDHVEAPTALTAASLSFIENIVYKFMNKTPIAPEDMVIALQDYAKWPIIHQVYLLPVMWLILKSQNINI